MAATPFTVAALEWRPYVPPIDQATATAEQRTALSVTPSNTKVSDYVLVLAHDAQSLTERTPLFNGIMYAPGGLSRAERELGALAASVVNRCVYCASVHARRFNELTKTTDVVEEIYAHETGARLDARQQAIFDYSVRLSQCPAQADATDIDRLRGAGLTDLQILDLTHSAAIFGWANRLMHTLGEPIDP